MYNTSTLACFFFRHKHNASAINYLLFFPHKYNTSTINYLLVFFLLHFKLKLKTISGEEAGGTVDNNSTLFLHLSLLLAVSGNERSAPGVKSENVFSMLIVWGLITLLLVTGLWKVTGPGEPVKLPRLTRLVWLLPERGRRICCCCCWDREMFSSCMDCRFCIKSCRRFLES